MRLSWLDPQTVSAALQAIGSAEPPDGIEPERWPAIENLVRRAEVVGSLVRTQGVDAAVQQFGQSRHAVEVAVVIMACASVGRAGVEQVRTLLECDIDEDILYGTFLRLLVDVEKSRDETLAIYESFHAKVLAHTSDHPQWPERLAVVREGLAELYIASARYDEGHSLFEARHLEDTGDLTVALAAARSFLAAGQSERAADWLGKAADRAKQHGRPAMETRLREKQRVLKERSN